MIIRSISGVRGITDSELTVDEVRKYAQAVHRFFPKGVIMLGRDSRPSGADLLATLVDELLILGRDVIFCGIVPTPTVQFMVERTEAIGGVIITASHNPIEWNGLKFVRGDGTFFLPGECDQLFDLADNGISVDKALQSGFFWQENNAIQKHVIHNVCLKCIDLNAIRKRHFKVVIDAVNGAGAFALPAMLDSLGCEVVELNCEPSGEFTRGTEPLPHNLSDLCNAVKTNYADVGFATDPDADRLAVVSEKGEPLGEEYTLVLAADGYLRTTARKEVLVTNLSTSMALDKLAEHYGCQVERSAVGEINVVRKMIDVDAELGGEGNGGVILREAHLGRDSLVGVTMVLNRMAQSKIPLSEIHSSLPQYEIIKDKINLEKADIERIFDVVQTAFSNAEVNTVDGLKFTWNERWIHLRKSNTEPIMRIYAEAPTAEEARKLIDAVKSIDKLAAGRSEAEKPLHS